MGADIIDRVKYLESPPFRPTLPADKELLFSSQYYELMQWCWTEKPTDRPDFLYIVNTLNVFSADRSRLHCLIMSCKWTVILQASSSLEIRLSSLLART